MPAIHTRVRQVLIIGGGLGGLSAAIHLRLAGFGATLFEANDAVGGRAGQLRFSGFTFDAGPTLLNYPWVFESLFQAAGRRLADYVELLPVDPSIRFLWPGGESFQLGSHLRRLIAEVERLESGAAPGLMRFLADAHAKYAIAFEKLACRNADGLLDWVRGVSPIQLWRTSVWRSLDAELARFFKHPRLRQALGSYGMYLGGSPHQLPGFFSILPYGELAHGLWLPRGGIYALVRAVERLARELGVEIETARRVRRIQVEQNAVKGIEFEDGERRDAAVVVSNVDVPHTRRTLLPRSPRPERELTMTPSVMTFYWGIRGPLSNADHHTIFMPGDPRREYDALFRRQEIPGELPFYLSIASRTDPSLAPAGDSAAFILVPLPRLSRLEGWGGGALREHVKAQVLERLRRHGVEIAPEDIVAEQALVPADWAERFGLYDGSAFGAAHTLWQMGPWRYPNRDRNRRGLYYVGASTTPGTGLPMVTLGGGMTAERVRHDLL